MKKKRIPKDSPPAVERYTVGSGLTQSEKIRVIPSLETLPIIEKFFRQDFTFSGRINIPEKWAIQILQAAGLPTDPKGLYGIPDGLPAKHIGERIPGRTGTGTLLAILDARGFREREHKEWYAAEILFEARRLRNILSRIQEDPGSARKEADTLAQLSLDLGLLIYEAIGFKFPYEADALLGQGDRERRRSGGLTTGQRTREAAEERNAEVLRRNAELLAKNWPENKRAVYIAAEMKRSSHTIRGIIRRNK